MATVQEIKKWQLGLDCFVPPLTAFDKPHHSIAVEAPSPKLKGAIPPGDVLNGLCKEGYRAYMHAPVSLQTEVFASQCV
jgi:hypothetical protein